MINAGKKKVPAKVIIAIVVSLVAFLSIILAIGVRFIKKQPKKYNSKLLEYGEDLTRVESLQYDLATLEVATNKFSDENKLGEGGFGGVYKGVLSNGQEIAVKRLSKSSSQGVQEFKNEVLLVAKLQHRNLLRLLGFCIAGEEKLLVSEYVPNRSLDHFLFDSKKQGQLNWEQRYKIIGGIARGCFISIKILDLESYIGILKIFGMDQTQGNTSRAWKLWRDGRVLEFVDEAIRDACSINEATRCMHLGLLCVQESIEDRPTMATTVLMLDSYSVSLPMPQQPAFYIKSYFRGDSDKSTSKSMPSVNNVSVTEVEAR
ncbi:Cysteine-rich receptor-like protein kinase 10 [Bienertia sinuspersici]